MPAVQEVIKTVTDSVKEAATVNAVFGEARVMNNRALIPVAMVCGGFGAGAGEGVMPGGEEPAESGSGGGGGGGFNVRPLAVLEVTDTGTKFIPILDVTKIALATLGFLSGALWIMAKAKHHKHHHGIMKRCC